MHPIPDTPPDGDFARYVEQLSARSAYSALARDAGAEAPSAKSESRGTPVTSASSKPAEWLSGLSLWSLVRWALLAWIALQVFQVFFPRIGMLSLPLLLAVAGCVLYRFRQTFRAASGGELRRLAGRVAKEFNQRK